MIRFPKTVVLSITTHGGLEVVEDELPEFRFQGKQMIWIQTAPIGAVNYLNEEQATQYNGMIAQKFQEAMKKKEVTPFTQMIWDSFMALLTPSTKKGSSASPSKVSPRKLAVLQEFMFLMNEKDKPYDNPALYRVMKKSSDLEDFRDYYHTFQSRNKAFLYNSSSHNKVVNKRFAVVENHVKRGSNYDTIRILNMPHESNDVFEMMLGTDVQTHMNQHGMSQYTVTFREIVEFLTSHGAERIIVFDFSCNMFDRATKPRTIRQKRRMFYRQNVHINANQTKKRKLSASSRGNRAEENRKINGRSKNGQHRSSGTKRVRRRTR